MVVSVPTTVTICGKSLALHNAKCLSLTSFLDCAGDTACGTICVNTNSDSNNCGACNKVVSFTALYPLNGPVTVEPNADFVFYSATQVSYASTARVLHRSPQRVVL
jgi:hypothetical protein